MAEKGRRSFGIAGLFFSLLLGGLAFAAPLDDQLAKCRADLARARAMKAEIEAKPDDYADVPETLAQLGQAIGKLEAEEKRLLKAIGNATPPKRRRPTDSEERAAKLDAARQKARELRAEGRWNLEPRSPLKRMWRGSDERLGDSHSDFKYTAEEFCDWAGDSSLSELRRPDVKRGAFSREWWMSRGPKGHRYVYDPGDPGRVIDMRHFFAAGSRGRLGEIFGLGIETGQWIFSKILPSASARAYWAATAFDPQDFYSNALGVDFFARHYDPKGPSVGRQLRLYFREREEGLR